MNEVAVKPEPLPEARHARPLARELAAACRSQLNRYRHEQGLSAEEAAAKAEEPCSLPRLWKLQDLDPQELTWENLQEMVGRTGTRAADRWEVIQQAAREMLRSGHWAAGMLEGRESRPWDRAMFLAIREDLAEGWQPRNGIERQLIDQMAQAQTGLNFWLKRHSEIAAVEGDEAAEPSLAMADRYHRIFLRTARALCSLRKAPLAVVVQNAGQVNVGGQQVNVAGGGI
jgi:hypothetical protein